MVDFFYRSESRLVEANETLVLLFPHKNNNKNIFRLDFTETSGGDVN